MSILCTGFHTGFDSGRREISGGKLYSALGVSNCKPTIYGDMSILCTGFHTGFDSGRREISGGKLYSALGVSNCKPTIYGDMIYCVGFHTGFVFWSQGNMG